jgi:hypothetical protein
MGSDDRVFGPPREGIEEDGFNTPPKPKKKKPYGIERRYVGERLWGLFDWDREWHLYRRYSKSKSRDEAFDTLMSKQQHKLPSYYYRKIDDV